MLGTPLPHRRDPARHRLPHTAGWLLVMVATSLTVLFGYMIVDAATGDYVGGEVNAVWALTAIEGVLTGATWTGAVALLRIGDSL